MGLADEVRALADQAPRCGKREWILDRLGAEAEEFKALEADPSIPPRALHRALEDRGFALAPDTVGKWCRKARS